jgi:hypothetical protein
MRGKRHEEGAMKQVFLCLRLLVAALVVISCTAPYGGYWIGDLSQPGGGDLWVREQVRSIRSQSPVPPALAPIRIIHPYDGALFPLDIASPVVEWRDGESGALSWLITVEAPAMKTIYRWTRKDTWTPPHDLWESIKTCSIAEPAHITITGLGGADRQTVVSRGRITIRTSPDRVEAPILYRQVPPVFSFAQQNPQFIKWRLGDVTSYDPPGVVMEKQPICGSCHSTSADGRILGMDMDYRRDKGAYLLATIREEMHLSEHDFISWNSFPRIDHRHSTGLYSRVSPSGKYVVSTVNEISLLIKMDDPYCSQLFYPLRGILALYAIHDREFRALSGADDRGYVHTAPEWSPDETYVLFSRVKQNQALITSLGKRTIFKSDGDDIHVLNSRYPVQFDICRLPFNSGEGGIAQPLEGASHNGKSNYYPRYSPDGKWIVFTQSQTGLVIQPDARLYIMPAEGGEPRLMSCNPGSTTSWHSWSPNSRWLVFVSKAHTPITELFIAHVDQNGIDTPPVRLGRFSDEWLAANVPEFLNIRPDALRKIQLSKQ